MWWSMQRSGAEGHAAGMQRDLCECGRNRADGRMAGRAASRRTPSLSAYARWSRRNARRRRNAADYACSSRPLQCALHHAGDVYQRARVRAMMRRQKSWRRRSNAATCTRSARCGATRRRTKPAGAQAMAGGCRRRRVVRSRLQRDTSRAQTANVDDTANVEEQGNPRLRILWRYRRVLRAPQPRCATHICSGSLCWLQESPPAIREQAVQRRG